MLVTFDEKRLRNAVNCTKGYRLIEESLSSSNSLANHRFLARLTVPEPMYVDSFHYSGSLNKALADQIALYLQQRGIAINKSGK